MGLLSAIGNVVGSLAGDLWEDEQTRSYNKKNYKYNSWLQGQNEEFQKYMAENAHQMEMADLQKAGLNPALTTTGSSAGSIAGSSAGGSTSSSGGMQMGNIIDAINNTRMTNADVQLKKAQTAQVKKETRQGKFGWFGEELGNDIVNTIATPVRHVKKQWNSAKPVERKKNESDKNYKKRVWKNILLDE